MNWEIGLAVVAGFLGVAVGIVPIWFGLLIMFTFLIFEGAKIFRAEASEPVNPFEQIASAWVTSLQQRQEVKPRANWNCKNCGGPNINQIKCEYCGQVKE